jgi:hypothetical protein
MGDFLHELSQCEARLHEAEKDRDAWKARAWAAEQRRDELIELRADALAQRNAVEHRCAALEAALERREKETT